MTGTTPFHDLAAFVSIPRIGEIVLSPDGTRLLATVQLPDPPGTRWTTSIWELDPTGARPARRLTRSAKGESLPAFLPDGDALFVSARPDPLAKEADDQAGSLWRLPVRGEAEAVLTRLGGFAAVRTARESRTVLLVADVLGSLAHDPDLRKARKERGVTAILHETAGVRFWDHDLGPGAPHLLRADAPAGPGAWPPPDDLVPEPGRALDEGDAVLTPDGRTAVITWTVPGPGAFGRRELHVVDVATGERRVLLADEGADFDAPALSSDGRTVACTRTTRPAYDRPQDTRPWIAALDGTSAGTDPCPAWDRWPTQLVWSPDGRSLYATADEGGHAPIFRIDPTDGRVVRLTASGAHTSVCVAPDGTALYAVRSTVDRPPHVVRYATDGADQEPVVLPGPAGAEVAVPGRVEHVEATGADGTPVRAWLVLPDTPAEVAEGRGAPLLVWVHGGPLASWNGWHWRWNPWVAAARGYAVLLPDPAFSTGYGLDMVRRGWGQWGGHPFTDVLALVDETVGRDDVDGDRTALLGGSYGGYVANWTATQTDRFRCIVTHASLWSLEQFAHTTDVPGYWRAEWGDDLAASERMARWSPDRQADRITTPVLVIHGDKDYRVPIGEALRLWDDLTARGVSARFLYFPTEHHWITTPGNARIWYETVLAFCDEHVLGLPWQRPALL